MASDDRYTVNMKVNQEIWDSLHAIMEENDLETIPQTFRFLIRRYKKDKEKR